MESISETASRNARRGHEDEQQPPVKRFRVGSITAAVWKNDGNFSVTLQKSYKEKDSEEWKNTNTLFHGDVVCAMKALERAERFIAQ
jgi:hypothetical protein